MDEPILKKKNILNKIINNQILVTIVTVFMVTFILIGASYAILNGNDDELNSKISIQIGNMQAVLSAGKDPYTFSDKYQKPVPDAVGLAQDAYQFSLTNTGNNDIGYYEIRLVDQENKHTTLAHKYIRFAVQRDSDDYSAPNNLGDNNSVLYAGTNLPKGKTINFNLKMWIDEQADTRVFNKSLYGAIEVTLYQKYNVYDYYLLYNTNGGTFSLSKTRLGEPLPLITPNKEGYNFLGWSSSIDGEVEYRAGDNYPFEKGVTLYAIWGSNV